MKLESKKKYFTSFHLEIIIYVMVFKQQGAKINYLDIIITQISNYILTTL